MHSTPNALLIWAHLVARLPGKLLNPVNFGHLGLVNLPHKGGPGASRGQMDSNVNMMSKAVDYLLVMAFDASHFIIS